MKFFNRTLLAVSLLATAVIFTSCSKDDDQKPAPAIVFDQSANTTVAEGTAITGKVTTEIGLKEVKFFYVRGNDATSFKTEDKFDDKNNYVYRVELAGVTSDITGIKISATDKDGQTSERTLAVKTSGAPAPSTALSTAATFYLGYPSGASNPATANGITYSTNPSATTAKFTGDFVMLTQAEYNAITTVEGLAAAYTSGTKAADFTVASDASFTAKYLIVKDGSTYRLVNMTALNFVAGNNKGTFTEKH